MRIYVGNLSRDTTRAELRDLFAEYGTIGRVGLAKDRPGGTSRGYGLVEMDEDAEGKRAITALNGAFLRERPLKVRELPARADRTRSNGNAKS